MTDVINKIKFKDKEYNIADTSGSANFFYYAICDNWDGGKTPTPTVDLTSLEEIQKEQLNKTADLYGVDSEIYTITKNDQEALIKKMEVKSQEEQSVEVIYIATLVENFHFPPIEELREGTTIRVCFNQSNQAVYSKSIPYLQINGQNKIQIKKKDNQTLLWDEGDIKEFTYKDGYWHIQNANLELSTNLDRENPSIPASESNTGYLKKIIFGDNYPDWDENNNLYQGGDSVHYKGKLYTALRSTSEKPTTTSDYWVEIGSLKDNISGHVIWEQDYENTQLSEFKAQNLRSHNSEEEFKKLQQLKDIPSAIEIIYVFYKTGSKVSNLEPVNTTEKNTEKDDYGTLKGSSVTVLRFLTTGKLPVYKYSEKYIDIDPDPEDDDKTKINEPYTQKVYSTEGILWYHSTSSTLKKYARPFIFNCVTAETEEDTLTDRTILATNIRFSRTNLYEGSNRTIKNDYLIPVKILAYYD